MGHCLWGVGGGYKYFLSGYSLLECNLTGSVLISCIDILHPRLVVYLLYLQAFISIYYRYSPCQSRREGPLAAILKTSEAKDVLLQ